jgi:hypothetical protein
MTNLEAIKASDCGKYQLSDNVYLKALLDRGITSTSTYGGISEAMELATADIYKILATGTNVKEAGYEITVPERNTLLSIANSIYQRWGYPLIGATTPKVKAVQPW